MLTILVADIFGNSPALRQLAAELAEEKFLIIDPYSGKMVNFANEQTAYDYFNHNVGLPRYAQQLQDKLATINQLFNLIAFSVGGSAVWLNSEWLAKSKVNRVTCFYASQIRHHCTLQPNVNIELVFPRYEKQFDIEALKETLSQKRNVTIEQSEYLHGFMNQLSENFSQPAYQNYKRWITGNDK